MVCCVAVEVLSEDSPWQGCLMIPEFSVLLDVQCPFDCFVVFVV